MEFDVPLMIGGATTSKAHTAVKIEQNYEQPTVWVKDASRAVGVAQNLISEGYREGFVRDLRADYEKIREAHLGKQKRIKFLTLKDARVNKMKIDWANYTPPVPNDMGIQIIDDMPLEFLLPYIDWTPFFHTWELKGSFPKIFSDPDKGKEAEKLFEDAITLLAQVIDEKWLRARGVIGLFPANSVHDDDIEVYTDDERKKVLTTLHHLRQQTERPAGKPNRCLADFVAPKESGLKDYIGGFAVTAGIGIEEHVKRFEAEHDDYHAIMLKALADRLAEAFAEHMHDRIRHVNWGFEKGNWTPENGLTNEGFSNEALIREQYTGIRPAPGYPACPVFAFSALSFLVSRDFLRAAVLLCIVLVDEAWSSFLATSL